MTEKTTVTLPGGVQVGLQGTTLVVLVGIGFFARDAMEEQLEALAQTQETVENLGEKSSEMSSELKALKSQVETNQQLRAEFENYRQATDEKLNAILACAKNKRKCP